MTPEEEIVAQRISAKVDVIGVLVKVLVAERNLLRTTLFGAYTALKSLDLAEDALGMGQDGPDSWSLRDELYHNIEAALKLDEEKE